jgi:hypothetical protein
MATVTVCFTLDSESDRDLVRWLDSLRNRNRSEAIRNVLRQHIECDNVTLDDVYWAVKEIDQRLQVGARVSEASTSLDEDSDEPADVVAALDKLGS